MKTSNSKLFRKVHKARKASRVQNNLNLPLNNSIEPIANWWKSRNVKDSQ